MKYIVYCRYNYYGPTGMTFTDWFTHSNHYDNEEDAKAEMKRMKSATADVDKHTKRIHQYEIRYIDETLLPQIKLKRPRGRAKKISEDVLNDICTKLFKSKNGTVKIDKSIYVYVVNSEEYTQYIANKITKKYNGEKWPRYWYDKDNCYILLKDKSQILL